MPALMEAAAASETEEDLGEGGCLLFTGDLEGGRELRSGAMVSYAQVVGSSSLIAIY